MSRGEKKKKHKSRKHKYSVLPYFQVSFVFVLISMIVVVPVCIGAMNIAVSTVHKAQEVFVRDFNDIEAKTDYQGSDKESGTVSVPALSVAQKLGVLTCDKVGLNADVYYGINRVSLRNGVAVNVESSQCGQGENVEIYGYVSKDFKVLNNLEIDDVIKFETLWGTYKYRVSSKQILSKSPNPSGSENLILATQEDNKAFSSFSENKLYIVAEKISGPNAEEVKQ